jgi:hypothetical protein
MGVCLFSFLNIFIERETNQIAEYSPYNSGIQRSKKSPGYYRHGFVVKAKKFRDKKGKHWIKHGLHSMKICRQPVDNSPNKGGENAN